MSLRLFMARLQKVIAAFRRPTAADLSATARPMRASISLCLPCSSFLTSFAQSFFIFSSTTHLGEKAVSDTVSDSAPYPKYQNPIPYRIPQLVSDTVSDMNGIRNGIGFPGIRYGIRCADIRYGIGCADIRYGIRCADIQYGIEYADAKRHSCT